MLKPKIILGIETSCDETAAAVAQKTKEGVIVLSNIVASSADLQAKYGGVVPEQAAREQLASIIPVIQEALNESQVTSNEIDAIAVTQGPGLIGSLLVGVETAKTLSLVWDKPLIPVNHLIGHFYANWITDHLPGVPQAQHHLEGVIPEFPAISLLVSGGHTDLILMKDHGKYKYLGGTRDDAAGECFDKCARLLGLPYPGGPAIEKGAENGNPKAYNLPRPMIDSDDFDFSFSGLKTAVVNLVRAGGAEETRLPDGQGSRASISNLCASIQEAIVDVLVTKTIKATQAYKVDQIVVAGGVAANRKLREGFAQRIADSISRAVFHIPPPGLCTDNAAYIAAAAFYNFKPIDPLKLQANPNFSLLNNP